MMMTTFELFDNFFQTAVMLVCAGCAGALAWRRRSPEFLLLAFAYLCWMSGTLYYVLYLKIVGVVPHVFYVSEIAWIAAWLFLLSMNQLRADAEGVRRWPPWVLLPSLPVLAVSVTFADLNGSALIAILFGVSVAAVCAVSLCRLAAHTGAPTPRILLAAIALQGAVYIVSAFTADYARFNAYFAADLLLTLALASLLPALAREVRA